MAKKFYITDSHISHECYVSFLFRMKMKEIYFDLVCFKENLIGDNLK